MGGVFKEYGYEQSLVSPEGGRSPLEPRSLKFPNDDRTARAWHDDPERMALLEAILAPDEVDPAEYNAIYFTGDHAVMHDFPGSAGLQRITREIWEHGGVVPYNAEEEMKERGARYEKARLPFVS